MQNIQRPSKMAGQKRGNPKMELALGKETDEDLRSVSWLNVHPTGLDGRVTKLQPEWDAPRCSAPRSV